MSDNEHKKGWGRRFRESLIDKSTEFIDKKTEQCKNDVLESRNDNSGKKRAEQQPASVAKRGKKNNKANTNVKKTRTVPGKENEPEANMMVSVEDALERRYSLERRIVSLVGGGTGMQIILRRLEQAAKEKKQRDYVAYEGVFLGKAEQLQQLYQEFIELREMKNVKKEPDKEEFYRQLAWENRDEPLYQGILQIAGSLKRVQRPEGTLPEEEEMLSFLAEMERLLPEGSNRIKRRNADAASKDAGDPRTDQESRKEGEEDA